MPRLLDHLVSADEDRGRHGQTQLLGRFGIDHQFKLRCLHHQQVSGLLTLENAADIQASLTVSFREVGAVAYQPGVGVKVKKKSAFHFEIYGSSFAAENKGHCRWVNILWPLEKTGTVGSFHGPLATATEHAKAAVSRLKERAKNGHHCMPIGMTSNPV